MSRIRTIKPDFWTNSRVVSLPMESRLFYIGMWNFVDDYGVIEDDPVGLKLKIMPADNVDAAAVVDLLVARGRVQRATTTDGKRVLVVPGIIEHQYIDKRATGRFGHPADFVYHDTPVDPTDPRTIPDTPADPRGLPGLSTLGREGKGREDTRAPSARICSPAVSVDADFVKWYEQYPRKVAKQDAQKAYTKARKRVDASVLLVGLNASKAQWDEENRPTDKVPYPASWLNRGEWDSEYEHSDDDKSWMDRSRP